jgi:hypothetical protein
MEFKGLSSECSFCVAIVILSAAIVPGVRSYVYSMGQDVTPGLGRHRPYIFRYENDWEVGAPLRVMAGVDFTLEPVEVSPTVQRKLGWICHDDGKNWAEVSTDQTHTLGHYDFNCEQSVDDVNKNQDNTGYRIGGLNLNGVTIAICHVVDHTLQDCDPHLDGDAPYNPKGGKPCYPYLRCQ